MGGQRYSGRVLEWAQQWSAGQSFTLASITTQLDIDAKQARTALRRFVNEGKLEQLGAQTWRIIPAQTSLNGDIGHAEDNYDSPARRAREVTRTVPAITFEQIDIFTDGASLLRSDDGEFYRGYITKLD